MGERSTSGLVAAIGMYSKQCVLSLLWQLEVHNIGALIIGTGFLKGVLQNRDPQQGFRV